MIECKACGRTLFHVRFHEPVCEGCLKEARRIGNEPCSYFLPSLKFERVCAVVEEWRKGCTNGSKTHPEDCVECTIEAMRAIARAVET